jgi:hypothetical protein
MEPSTKQTRVPTISAASPTIRYPRPEC